LNEAAVAGRELCTTHQVRLVRNPQTSRLECPVCEQMSNQNRLRRRRR
jgi:hypothetical protein